MAPRIRWAVTGPSRKTWAITKANRIPKYVRLTAVVRTDRPPPGRISSAQLRARLTTARIITRKLNHRCLNVISTPATMTREKKMWATNLPNQNSPRVQDDEISQREKQQACEAGFIGPKMPEMEANSLHKAHFSGRRVPPHPGCRPENLADLALHFVCSILVLPPMDLTSTTNNSSLWDLKILNQARGKTPSP
jgi:hypothetical protein